MTSTNPLDSFNQKSSEKSVPQSTKSKTKLILIIIGISLVCCLLTAGISTAGYIFYESQNDSNTSDDTDVSDKEDEDIVETTPEDQSVDQNDTDQDNQDDNDTQDTSTSGNYSGMYTTASMPNNWEIIEYVDGAGSVLLTSGEYEGLTGLEILNPEDEALFTFTAVEGIGGVGACTVIYTFDDTSDNYIQQIKVGSPGTELEFAL